MIDSLREMIETLAIGRHSHGCAGRAWDGWLDA